MEIAALVGTDIISIPLPSFFSAGSTLVLIITGMYITDAQGGLYIETIGNDPLIAGTSDHHPKNILHNGAPSFSRLPFEEQKVHQCHRCSSALHARVTRRTNH